MRQTPTPPPASTLGKESTLLLGGARADFVASLGRKVAELDKLVGTAHPGTRQDLRRKLHALASAAKSMKLDPLERALAEAMAQIDARNEQAKLAEKVGFEADEQVALRSLFATLPTIAWGEPVKAREVAIAVSEPERPHALLVFGDDRIAKSLETRSPFAARAAKNVQDAIAIAAERTPSVVLVDGDLPEAAAFVEALLDQSATADVPVLAIGTFPTKESEAPFLALGVARTLPKPVDPLLLRRLCHEIVAVKDEHTERMPLGEPTLERMVSLLENEFRRALLDGAVTESPAVRIPLGEGAEVLGALWSAIARIREVVTARSGGKIRWGAGPDGAYPLAATAASLAASVPVNDRANGKNAARTGDSRASEGRDEAFDVSLRGRVVVIADDDPAVTWFLADLLRHAGCIVHEAFDGEQALTLCETHVPDLLITDILMPKRDGFALCRRMKRDLALRDTAVILLSWKEDLLQRVRELGADARGYLRKESQAPAILSRVREVLRNRDRFEARLREETTENSELRGRIDGTSVYRLFQLVAATRADARIAIRDATLLFEIELREGRPVRAVKSSGNGRFERGPRALAEALGVTTGRFVVAKSNAPIEADLDGSLEQQLAIAVERSRSLSDAIAGTALLDIEKVSFDREALRSFLDVAPPDTKALLQELDFGASPSDMLFAKRTDGNTLETLLLTMVARAIVTDVRTFPKDEALASILEPSQPIARPGGTGSAADESAVDEDPDAFFAQAASEPPPALEVGPPSLAFANGRPLEESPIGVEFAQVVAATAQMPKVVLKTASVHLPKMTPVLDLAAVAPPASILPDDRAGDGHQEYVEEELSCSVDVHFPTGTTNVPVVSAREGYETPPLGHLVALIESPTVTAEFAERRASATHVETNIDGTLYGGVPAARRTDGAELDAHASVREAGNGADFDTHAFPDLPPFADDRTDVTHAKEIREGSVNLRAVAAIAGAMLLGLATTSFAEPARSQTPPTTTNPLAGR
jgi:DNA-binding response OmpR family regulator